MSTTANPITTHGLDVGASTELMKTMEGFMRSSSSSLQNMHKDSMGAMKEAMSAMQASQAASEAKYQQLAVSMQQGFTSAFNNMGSMFNGMSNMMSNAMMSSGGSGLGKSLLGGGGIRL